MCDPMNPAPPVTSIFAMLYSVRAILFFSRGDDRWLSPTNSLCAAPTPWGGSISLFSAHPRRFSAHLHGSACEVRACGQGRTGISFVTIEKFSPLVSGCKSGTEHVNLSRVIGFAQVDTDSDMWQAVCENALSESGIVTPKKGIVVPG